MYNEIFYINNRIEVIKNPTDKQYCDMILEFKKEYPQLAKIGEPSTRHTYDIQGNKYIWKSTDSMHYQVELYIDKNYQTLTHQNKFFDIKYNENEIKNYMEVIA